MIAWLVVFVVAPTAILFVYSFCERDELGRVVFSYTLENYQRVFDPVYLRIFSRSIGYAGLTTAICIVVGYPVAYCIGRASEAWRQRLLLLIDRATDDHRIAKAGPVLDPIEVDAQPERIILIDAAALDEQGQRTDDAAGQLGDVSAFGQRRWRVVTLNDQGSVAGD